MTLIWLGFYILLSAYGVFLLADALYWRFHSRLTPARVVDFQKKRFLGRRLPVVVAGGADMGDEDANRCRIVKIDSLTYLIRSVYEGDAMNVRVHTIKPKTGRVEGAYPYLVGLVLQWPLFFTLVGYLDPVAQQGVSFLFFVAAMLFAFWILMRLVRFHY